MLQGFNDLETVEPDLALEWHPTKNDLSPKDVTKGSGKKVWWLGKCGHEWEATISDRNNGNGCPFCSGHRVLKGFNDLLSQKPSDAEDWDYEKNKEIEPFSIAAKSGRKVWWKCKKCGFEWETSPHDKKACPNCNSCKTL